MLELAGMMQQEERKAMSQQGVAEGDELGRVLKIAGLR